MSDNLTYHNYTGHDAVRCTFNRPVNNLELECTRAMEVADKEVIRILSKLERPIYEEGCNLWMGPRNKDGKGGQHGCVSWRGATVNVSRLIFSLYVGDPRGYCILHKCVNLGFPDSDGRCSNPLHLAIGDQKENCADRKLAGNDGSKFTQEEEKEIVRRLEADPKLLHRELAAQFGVSTSLITLINTRNKGKRRNAKIAVDVKEAVAARRVADPKISLGALAREFGIAKASVYRILERKEMAE